MKPINEHNEELINKLESHANIMLGMTMDMRIPAETRRYLKELSDQANELLEGYDYV